MKPGNAAVYIHGKGGSAEEAEHYRMLFPQSEVIGYDYSSQTPWEAAVEFPAYFRSLKNEFDSVTIIANSIGAFFALHSLYSFPMEKAFFISPVVDMEQIITDIMRRSNVSEADLTDKSIIETANGETLSMEYLAWVRQHPVTWNVPTAILYGSQDNLQCFEVIRAFADRTGADVTVMENGEHWFHTKEQMAFLDEWIRKSQSSSDSE